MEQILNKYPSKEKGNYYDGNCLDIASKHAEKVAVAFVEWKDNNTTKDEDDTFVIWDRNADTFCYNYSDLYKYFINHIYNK